jgi:hypothetical protein
MPIPLKVSRFPQRDQTDQQPKNFSPYFTEPHHRPEIVEKHPLQLVPITIGNQAKREGGSEV